MRVLFHPEFPTMDGYTLVAMLHELDYQGVSDIDADFDLAVAWADRTWMDPDPALEKLAERMPVWNIDCRDISKRRVDEVMREVFGYGAEVDPRTWHGTCAVKTDENARGRGGVVTTPISDPDPRMVYQRLIECREHGRTVNYRVPVIAGTLPLCYVLERAPIVEHLKTDATACRLVDTDDLFSAVEQQRILAFCRGMHLDFGELDVLRDDDDGRIYIIDANKTPAGMGIAYRHRWTPAQRRTALQRLSAAFAQAVAEGRPQRAAL
jgi:hypothetical protein